MSVGIFKKIVALEVQVLQRGDDMKAEEAREFYNSLISYHNDYAKKQNNFWKAKNDKSGLCEDEEYLEAIEMATLVEKKIYRMQEWLRRFFEPVSPIKGSKKDPPVIATSLNSLLQKQKFYVQVINSLVPDCELSSNEAELQYEHVSQAYKEFFLNQSEIMTFVNDAAFDDQFNVFNEVQQNVLSVQKTLKNIFSSNNTDTLSGSKSKVNEDFNRTDRQNVIVEFLDSLYKKQKSLIEQIELIESKSNLGATEAETLHNHVSQLHESFNKNQAKIETYVNGPALDKELEMSGEILVKVMSLQTKLKEIFAPIVLPSSVKSNVIDESKQVPEADEAACLTSLMEKQKSLINDIESMKWYGGDLFTYCQPSEQALTYVDSDRCRRTEVETFLQNVLNLKQWFISNQKEIEKRVNGYDLQRQKNVSMEIQIKLKKFQIRYGFYCSLFAYVDLMKNRVNSSYVDNRVVSLTG